MPNEISQQKNIFQANCPAKINLFLKVIGKDQNYHQLQSLFAFLDIFDFLSVETDANFSLAIDGEFAANIDLNNNLLTKILDFFAEKFRISKNLKIHLTKNIPVGGGLGGGSSDAAYFIHALNEIFELKLSLIEMQEISLNFGSDIAFLLQNQAALIEKRGEKITPINRFQPMNCLVVNPKMNLSTKEVFLALNGEFSTSLNFSSADFTEENLITSIKNFGNDLQKAAIKILPEIAEILSNLKELKGNQVAQMSGSGSTCFAVFNNQENLELAYEKFRQNHPEFFVKKSQIISYV